MAAEARLAAALITGGDRRPRRRLGLRFEAKTAGD
jgi:hypothetical protein